MRIKEFGVEFDYETGILIDNNIGCDCHGGGGGKGAAPAPAPVIAPTAPVQEASVEIGEDEFDEDAKKKLKTDKGQLKLPLTPTENTGLKV